MQLFKRIVFGTIGVVTLAGLVIAAITYGPQRSSDTVAGGVWTCSMHPQIRQAGPGRCPICGMELIPVDKLSDAQKQLADRAGLEVETISRRELSKEVRTVGKIDYSERQVEFIAARIAGRVDRVHADVTGTIVKKGDHLVDIYSPDLYVAQDVLIRAAQRARAAKEKPGSQDDEYIQVNLDAARTKLRLLGILPEQIAEIEKSGAPLTYLTVYAPIGGTIIEKSVRPGQYVKDGDPLYRIADLDPIWLYLDIYESDLGWVRYGQKVDVSVEAYPNEKFEGTVVFIDPFLDDRTRTVRARANLKNTERKLKPAMYATAIVRVRLQADGTPEPTGIEGKYICRMHPEELKDSVGRCRICNMVLEKIPTDQPKPKGHDGHDHSVHAGRSMPSPAAETRGLLAIPVSAVLDTGRRQIAYRLNAEGAYELVELRLGQRAVVSSENGREVAYYPVFDGLSEGDKVVVRGGFLLDSQRQIEGMPSLLFPKGQSGSNLHAGHGMPAPPADGGHKH